jgi:hypothetical protein
MVGVDERIGVFVAEATTLQLVAFAASCVERGAAVFFSAIAPDEGRTADRDVFLELLDDLWRGTSLSAAVAQRHLELIAQFPEIQGDDEPPGILAFAYDAVAAMYYAYEYLVSGEAENIRYCSNHMLNSAGFIDNAAEGGGRNHSGEVATQTDDMARISTGRTTVAALRERAQTVGQERVEVLKAVFS